MISAYLEAVGLGALSRIERDLNAIPAIMQQSIDALAQEIRAGRREGTVMTTYDDDEAEVWKQFRRELLGDGFRSSAIHRFKPLIRNYLRMLSEEGQLEEVEPSEEPDVSDRKPLAPSAASSKRDSRRKSSLQSAIYQKKAPPSATPLAPRLVDCLTCGSDDVPVTHSAKLSYGHWMCHECLKRIFTMSVTDPQHMPPKCCIDEHIPLKHVDSLFSLKFKVLWNRKYKEYNTKNRIYCPAKGCGEWIKSSHFGKAPAMLAPSFSSVKDDEVGNDETPVNEPSRAEETVDLMLSNDSDESEQAGPSHSASFGNAKASSRGDVRDGDGTVEPSSDERFPAAPGMSSRRHQLSTWNNDNPNVLEQHREILSSEWRSKPSSLAELFRPPVDLISHSPWEATRNEAEEQGKLILVDVQDPSNFDCQVLNRDFWKAEYIRDTIKENFVFMQFDKSDPRGNPYINHHFHTGNSGDAYPHIAIVDPRTDEQIKVWSGSPMPKPVDFLVDLHMFLDDTTRPRAVDGHPQTSTEYDKDKKGKKGAIVAKATNVVSPLPGVVLRRAMEEANDASDQGIAVNTRQLSSSSSTSLSSSQPVSAFVVRRGSDWGAPKKRVVSDGHWRK